MRACICDVCGKVHPMKYYGLPAHWIAIEQRGDATERKPTDTDFDDTEYHRDVALEAVCCSWECVGKLAQRQKEAAGMSQRDGGE